MYTLIRERDKMNEQNNLPAQIKHIHTEDLNFKIPDCVGKNIRHLRKEKNLTQKNLADAIGCEPSYISHIERVSRSISIKHLFQIADAMDTTPATLVTDPNNQLSECIEILEHLDAEKLAQAKEWLKQINGAPVRRSA